MTKQKCPYCDVFEGLEHLPTCQYSVFDRITEGRMTPDATLTVGDKTYESGVSSESQPDDPPPPDQPAKPDEIWVCMDGRRIPVGQLHPDHMRNIIRMILEQKRRRIELRRALRVIEKSLNDDMDDDRKWGRD